MAVLIAHIADVATWAAFSKDWKESLPWAICDDNGDYHFHMAEMNRSTDGMERAMRFVRIMEDHVKLSYSVSLHISDIDRVKKRLWISGGFSIDHPVFRDIGANPYLLMYRCLMDTFHMRIRQQNSDIIPVDAPVDFYFDDRSEEDLIRKGWEEYLSSDKRAEVSKLYGAKPRFENDRRFLPLQAADLWAW